MPEFAQQVGGVAGARTQIDRVSPELPRILKPKSWLLKCTPYKPRDPWLVFLVGEAVQTLLSFWVQELRDLDRINRLFFPPLRRDSIPDNASLDFQADILNTTSS